MATIRQTALAILLLLAGAGAAAAAADRVALVIGNSLYQYQAPLANPANDVAQMARTLTEIGYDVTVHENLGENDMERALAAFADKADEAEIALVFYSGHGMEISGANYLIPVDAELRRERDAQFEAVELRKVRAAISGASRLKVVILDACRNNTFLASTRSGGARGLSRVVAQSGEIVAYSTAPGSVAQDGAPGGLSPYTRALSEKLLEDPDLDVRFLFTSIGRATEKYAGVEQRPYTEFAAILPDGQLPLGKPTTSRLDGAFQAALEAEDIEELRALLAEAPDHPLSAQARAMVEAADRARVDQQIAAALASQDRAELQMALAQSTGHFRRNEVLAALAIHDRLDKAVSARDFAELDRIWRETTARHPRREEMRLALSVAIFVDACGRLAGYGLPCPPEVQALATRPLAPNMTMAAAPQARAATPPPPPPQQPPRVAALNPPAAAPQPAPEPAPPADPLAGYLGDVTGESLGRATEVSAEWIQTSLKALGHLRGAIDGDMGPGTLAAVGAWREAVGAEGGEARPGPEEIVAIMKMGARRSPRAAAYLGVMYGLGVGVALSPDRSRALLTAAENEGFADAGAFLANISKTWK